MHKVNDTRDKVKKFYHALSGFALTKIEVGQRTTKGLNVNFTLANKIQLSCRIKLSKPHLFETFSVGSPAETLLPESQSTHLIFQILSS
jgi:hypothetical protein